VSLVLLAAVLLACLALIPLGLPGLWLMLAAALGFNALLPGPGPIGAVALVGTVLIAAAAEVLEFVVGARYTTRYGGSRRRPGAPSWAASSGRSSACRCPWWVR